MRARRTVNSQRVYRLPGGTEDNDLWVYHMERAINDSGATEIVTCSVWEPTKQEREAIANGENIRLVISGTMVPPMIMDTTDEALGKRPSE